MASTPEELLKLLFNRCDPTLPAQENDYVDCSSVRGGQVFVQTCLRELERSERHRHYLFSGHIGCGKSSELHALRDRLRDLGDHFPILLDTGEYLDEYDVASSDILLAIVAEVGSELRRYGLELADSYLTRRLAEVKQILFGEVELAAELSQGPAKLIVQQLKKSPDVRQQVRDELLPSGGTLIEEVNAVLDDARQQLRRKGYRDLMLILDNLEKVRQVKGRKEGESSLHELFLSRAQMLTGLRAHAVFTIPLPLARSHGTQLASLYGIEPFVLPMIKVEQRRSHQAYTPGYACLRQVVERRVAPHGLAQLLDADALEFMIRYSGGDLRALMRFIRAAVNELDALPVNLAAARRSLRQSVATIATSIPAEHWPKLAQLERSEDSAIDNSDPDYRAMLEQLNVLEYLNGDSQGDPFAEATPWYAVNPIVRELPRFKSVLRELTSP